MSIELHPCLLDELLVALEPRGGDEVVHGRGVDVAAEDELLRGDHPARQHVLLLGQRPVQQVGGTGHGRLLLLLA